jgi:stage III sporulation protein AF
VIPVIAAVTAWIKNIILVVLFASFMELLLPNSSMKKFIRVIMGIFIMLAILNPVLSFFQTEKPEEHIAVLGAKESTKDAKTDNINQLVASTVLKREELLSQAYTEELAKQISVVVKSIAGVEDAHAKVSIGEESKISKIIIYLKPATSDSKNNIKIESITLKKPEDPKLQDGLINKVKKTISELYQIAPKDIEVEPLP